MQRGQITFCNYRISDVPGNSSRCNVNPGGSSAGAGPAERELHYGRAASVQRSRFRREKFRSPPPRVPFRRWNERRFFPPARPLGRGGGRRISAAVGVTTHASTLGG
ncbi:Hypothetical protein NTJ_07031 [Nesidiocoris tenuis]|uniref:Uncharacterized protein n=1 Tax=Nesidiocoris tenuis TaxID=355587 RepID=A0ABN7AUU0_9HEMI|nr:Hypothetical protein NTJ_07031 [Nesidiocoris tenuis]